MGEVKLNVKRGPDLFQQVMDGLPERDLSRVCAVQRLPLCPICQHDFGNTQRIARPGGRWACMRGHGILS